MVLQGYARHWTIVNLDRQALVSEHAGTPTYSRWCGPQGLLEQVCLSPLVELPSVLLHEESPLSSFERCFMAFLACFITFLRFLSLGSSPVNSKTFARSFFPCTLNALAFFFFSFFFFDELVLELLTSSWTASPPAAGSRPPPTPFPLASLSLCWTLPPTF